MAITGTPSNIINRSSHDIVLISHITAPYSLYVLFINYYFINLQSVALSNVDIARKYSVRIGRKFNPLVTRLYLPYIATDATMPRDSHEYVRVSAATRTTMNDEEGVGNGVGLDRRTRIYLAPGAQRGRPLTFYRAHILLLFRTRAFMQSRQEDARERSTRSMEEVTLEKVDTRAIWRRGWQRGLLSAWLSSIGRE